MTFGIGGCVKRGMMGWIYNGEFVMEMGLRVRVKCNEKVAN